MKKSCSAKELNCNNDNKTCLYKHLWGINMKVVLAHVAKVSASEQKFECLPQMGTKSPLQLGDLTSESFLERMASCDNLLADGHRLKFGDEMIDNLIVLRMNKKFMDRIRSKNAISTMQFDNIEYSKRGTVQFVIIAFVSVTSIVVCY